MARVSAGTAQVVAIVVAVAAGVGLAVTGHSGSAPATVPYSSAAATVTTVTDQVSATGTVQSASTLDLAFGSSGLAVTSIAVHAGQPVQAGQVLATVDHTAATAALASAEAQLSLAQAQTAAAAATPSPTPTAAASVHPATTTAGCVPAPTPATATASPAPTASPSPTPSASSSAPTGGFPGGGHRGGGGSPPAPTPTASATATATPTSTSSATSTPSTGTLGVLAAAAARQASGCVPATPGTTATASRVSSSGSALGSGSSGSPGGGAGSLVSAQQQVSQAQAALGSTTLTAPQAGVVEAVNLVVGTLPGSPAVVLRATGFQVLVDVAEQDAPFVRVGQTGQATMPALGVTSDVTVVQGPISGAEASSTAGASVVSFPVLLSLPNPPPGLLPGMSAQVVWTAASRSGVLAVPTTAIRSGDTGDVVLVLVGGRAQSEPVTVGLSTSSMTQVVSGLRAGERVVTGLAG